MIRSLLDAVRGEKRDESFEKEATMLAKSASVYEMPTMKQVEYLADDEEIRRRASTRTRRESVYAQMFANEKSDQACPGGRHNVSRRMSTRLSMRGYFPNSAKGIFQGYSPGYKLIHNGNIVGTIESKVGEGAMGAVYLLKDCFLNKQQNNNSEEQQRYVIKVLREDLEGANLTRLEQDLCAEISILFAIGLHSLVASARGVFTKLKAEKDTTTARSTLLLLDYVECGSLESMMHSKQHLIQHPHKSADDELAGTVHLPQLSTVQNIVPDYRGELYADESLSQSTAEAILVQLLLGIQHIHERGILHSDVKPGNILCSIHGNDRLIYAKLSDFGLAAFGSRLKTQRNQWLLSAPFTGGTETYFSPEQTEHADAIRKTGRFINNTYSSAGIFGRSQLVTPATSDLYQIALTVLELYGTHDAEPSIPVDVRVSKNLESIVETAISRVSRSALAAWTPLQLEAWAQHALYSSNNVTQSTNESSPGRSNYIPQGKFIKKKIDGSTFLNYSKRDLMRVFDLSVVKTARLQKEIKRKVGGFKMPVAIATYLRKSLHANSEQRPPSAVDCLKLLGVTDSDGKTSPIPIPQVATMPLAQHPEDVIENSYCDIVTKLCEYEAYAVAFRVCIEWFGVSSGDSARKRALLRTCEMLKLGRNQIDELSLSRAARVHWHVLMLADPSVISSLAEALWSTDDSPPPLCWVDFSLQWELTGPVLDLLLGKNGIPSLEFLSLRHCTKLGGLIPSTLSACENLKTLDLHKCSFQAPLPTLPESLEYLDLARNNLQGVELSELFPPENTTNLEEIIMYRCGVGGSLDFLSELCSLRTIDLSGNNITGALPEIVPETIEIIILNYLNLDCEIPTQWKSLDRLRVLEMKHCKLRGNVFSALPRESLEKLSLSENLLEDSSAALANSVLTEFSALNFVYMQGCGLIILDAIIHIPPSLKCIYLGHNVLTGSVVSYPETSSLEMLSLPACQLEGQLPEPCSTTLLSANFSCNKISGPIPEYWTQPQRVSQLDISETEISIDAFPSKVRKRAERALQAMSPLATIRVNGNCLDFIDERAIKNRTNNATFANINLDAMLELGQDVWHALTTSRILLSAAYDITHEDVIRNRAGIPAHATALAYCYPIFGADWPLLERKRVHLDTPFISLLRYGGLAYFDKNGRVAAVNAICPWSTADDVPCVDFEERRQLPYTTMQALANQHRFVPVTLASLLARGARYFCWIRPNEELDGLSNIPGGAFVFLFHSPIEGPSGRNCYFPLRTIAAAAPKDPD